jgi:hypothetical protein
VKIPKSGCRGTMSRPQAADTPPAPGQHGLLPAKSRRLRTFTEGTRIFNINLIRSITPTTTEIPPMHKHQH